MSKYVKCFTSVAAALAATDIVSPATITVYEGDEHKLLRYCPGEFDIPLEIRGTTLENLYIVHQGFTGSTGESYGISNNLTHVTNSNTDTVIMAGSPYTGTLTADDGYTLNSVNVEMKGRDITSSVYSGGVISIPSATGHITVIARATAQSYTVSNTLMNVTNSNSSTSVEHGSAYTAVLTVPAGYMINTITIMMNGVDVTDSVYDNGTITIPSVDGPISIVTTGAEAWTVVNNLTNTANSNSAISVVKDGAYSATITPATGNILRSVMVKMDGVDITSTVYSNGVITIPSVTGDLAITAISSAVDIGYLKLTAIYTSTVYFKSHLFGADIYWSTDGTTWWPIGQSPYFWDYTREWDYKYSDTITINAGTVLYIRGTSGNYNFSYSTTEDWEWFGIRINSGKVKIEGEVNCILGIDKYDSTTVIPMKAYCHMFNGACISDASGIVIGSNPTGGWVYTHMFENCSMLEKGPTCLPATALSDGQYNQMFYNCTNLKTVPTLPATQMKASCYYAMFAGCQNITESPVLPAEVPDNNSYSLMFQNCYKLNKITCLANDIGAASSHDNWVQGITGTTGTFIKSADITEETWGRGDSGIPTGWVVQDA